MSNVADYAEARALRGSPDLTDLDPAVETGAHDEIAAALERAQPISDAAPVVSPLVAQWLRFRDQFAEAMEGGPHKIELLEADVMAGRAYFWPGENAAVVATVLEYPGGARDLQTLWAVGDAAEVLTLEPGIAATARLLGCSGVLVEGRRGWERMLKPLGYEPWSVTVRKVV